MRKTLGMGTLVIGGFLVLAIGEHEPTGAQQFGLGGGFGQVESPKPDVTAAARVYVRREFGAKAIPILEQLERPIPMTFETATRLGDVLEYIRKETVSDDMKNGIPIYVDDLGLQEAEQTLESPIQINLEGIPLRMTLELMLRQLDLAYHVYPDGLIEITSKTREHAEADPMLLILDELRALRAEVKELKDKVGSKE